MHSSLDQAVHVAVLVNEVPRTTEFLPSRSLECREAFFIDAVICHIAKVPFVVHCRVLSLTVTSGGSGTPVRSCATRATSSDELLGLSRVNRLALYIIHDCLK